jgi:hypothetical protein
MRAPPPSVIVDTVQSTGGIEMNVVVRDEKKTPRALPGVSRPGAFVGSAGSAAQTSLPEPSEQQVLEMERTFTDRWEW